MRAILKISGFPISQGWEKSLSKLSELELEDGNSLEFIESLVQLEKSYKEYFIIGNKSVRFFSIQKQKIKLLQDKFLNYEIPVNQFHKTYPYPLDQENLIALDSTPKLVDIIKLSGNDLAFIFCTKRYFSERQTLDPLDFQNELRSFLEDYDEVVTIKKYIRQLYDVVILRNNNIAEVRIDIGQGLSIQDRRFSFIQIIKEFNYLAKSVAGIELVLDQEYNFFTLINLLYESEEGKVCEIAFTTDQGSIKHEKMRRKDFDLREEIYHKAGRQAVIEQDLKINIYRIAILWKYKIDEEDNIETQPELLIPGQVQMLHQEYPVLNEVIIRKCSGLKDYDFVFDKIVAYLS